MGEDGQQGPHPRVCRVQTKKVFWARKKIIGGFPVFGQQIFNQMQYIITHPGTGG